jgi:Flp pilus assembly protein TadG
MLSFFKRRLKSFVGDTEGNTTLEVLIFVPFMLTVLAATFSLYDAFRFKSLNTKAAFTIADALSRETNAITPAYLDGMVSTLNFLTRSENAYSLRVSTVQYDADSQSFDIKWSQARGTFTPLQSAELAQMTANLPTLLDNETVIVVETHTTYDTPFQVDAIVTDDLFYNFTFTRPRFAPQLIWSDATPVDNITS